MRRERVRGPPATTAIIRVLIDTGMRLAECAGIRVDDVDFDDNVVVVTGKGRRERAVPFGAKSALAIDRYLRAPCAPPAGVMFCVVGRAEGRAHRLRYRPAS